MLQRRLGIVLTGLALSSVLVAEARAIGSGWVPWAFGLAAADTVAPRSTATWWGPEQLAAAVDSLTLQPGTTRIQLGRAFLTDPVVVELDGVVRTEDVDYGLDRGRGRLVLAEAPTAETTLVVRYHYAPASTAPRVILHESRLAAGDAAPEEPAPVTATSPPPTDSVEALRRSGALQVSGSKTISVQSGSQRDATVDQGLMLNVTGKITDTIGVRAEISDENLPIVPAGTSEELSDLDQVRIELFAPHGSALLGDFAIAEPLGTFAPYQRKLTGMRVEGRHPRGGVGVMAGAPRGERIELEFFGRESVQGPYELLDPFRADDSFIVAGTERVWVDGQPMVRGESRDYTIDYIAGSVTFTELRRIGAETRIGVDFEVSASAYARNVVSAFGDSLSAGPIRVHASWLREGDNADRPVGGSLSPEDQAILAAAGDDPLQALSSGVFRVPAGEEGEGDYVERQNGAETYYEYDPVHPDANYLLSFVRVGENKGDYLQDEISATGDLIYEFVGAGNGSYRIGRLLPLPNQTTAMVVGAGVGGPGAGGFLKGELDASDRDENVVSSRDDTDNRDTAWRVEGATPWVGGGGQELGVRVHGLAEVIGGDYYALGRIREPFFYEKWNLEFEPQLTREAHNQLRMDVKTTTRATSVSVERLDRATYDGQRSRWAANGQIVGPFDWRHDLSWMNADRGELGSSIRRDGQAEVGVLVDKLRPYLRYAGREWSRGAADTRQGYRYTEWAAGMASQGGGLRVQARRRLADSLNTDGTIWAFDRDVREVNGAATGRLKVFNWNMDATYRETQRPTDAAEITRLGRIGFGYRPAGGPIGADVSYRAGNNRTRVLERKILFVGEGQGDYDIDGNPVGKNLGSYDLVLAPGDSLISTTDVAVSAKLDWDWSQGPLGGFNWTSVWNLEEQNDGNDVEAVLALNPAVIRDPLTTVFGQERLRHDLSLLRKLRRTDVRLSYTGSVTLDRRFSLEPERLQDRRRKIRLEQGLLGGWSFSLNVGDGLRQRFASTATTNFLSTYNVREVYGGGELRYRAGARTRFSAGVQTTRREDQLSTVRQQVGEIVPGVVTDFLRGRWTAELRLAHVTEFNASAADRPFFFEQPGTHRRASLIAQWGGRGLLTFTVRYQLRDEQGRDTVQDLTVETRARF